MSLIKSSINLNSSLHQYVNAYLDEKFGQRISKIENKIAALDHWANQVIERSRKLELAPKINSNILDRNVNDMNLSVRAKNCLEHAEIKTIGELIKKTELDLLQTKYFGRKSINEIKGKLEVLGLQLPLIPCLGEESCQN